MSDLQDQRVVVLLAVAGAAMAAGEVEYVQSVVGQEVGVGRLAGAERLGATDDLHDLGADGLLPGPVPDPAPLGHHPLAPFSGPLLLPPPPRLAPLPRLPPPPPPPGPPPHPTTHPPPTPPHPAHPA